MLEHSNSLSKLAKLSSDFKDCLFIPNKATNTVYVEGLPHDATEREVSRKLFSILVLILLNYRYI